ncbi:hypothetical protein B4144_2850 [Bacillus atrophaeus]|nr:hypothetical protein B4144_2850 [Bacillus atrophaeus]
MYTKTAFSDCSPNKAHPPFPFYFFLYKTSYDAFLHFMIVFP